MHSFKNVFQTCFLYSLNMSALLCLILSKLIKRVRFETFIIFTKSVFGWKLDLIKMFTYLFNQIIIKRIYI